MWPFLQKIFYVLAVLAGVGIRMTAGGPDFNRDIRPILSQNCFQCHGVDEKSRKGGLRLDRRETSLKPAKSGEPAIVPGRPEASELLKRIAGVNPEEVMPPPSANKVLTAEEKVKLRQWIAAGANYAPHWAFVTPQRPAVPVVVDAVFPVRGAIDAFVLAAMQKQGLAPSPEASRMTLCRRLFLDLTGLPPSPEEADAFAGDATPDAVEKLVDRLIATPQYGERWARRWLDLARYADTNGYEQDSNRTIWPYRDWVVRAINANLPFDRFTAVQIAGDLLPGAGQDDIVATGFHRNSMLNEEAGIDPLEYRFHSMTDRVSTTGTTWLGLTLGCAQCHSHKYDPIEHSEYYKLMAFLDNADEPRHEIVNDALREKKRQATERIAALEAALPGRWPGLGSDAESDLKAKFAAWEAAERTKAAHWTIVRPSEMKSSMPELAVQANGAVLAAGDITKSDAYQMKFPVRQKAVTAIRLEVLPHESLPEGGPGMTYYEDIGKRGDFFLSEITVTNAGRPAKIAAASQSFAAGNSTAATAIDGDMSSGWSIHGGQGKPHAAVFRFEFPQDLNGDFSVTMMFEATFACALGHFRVSVTSDAEAEARGLTADLEAALLKPDPERTEEERRGLRLRFFEKAPELTEAVAELKIARDAIPRGHTTLVRKERPASIPRKTFVRHRGEWLQPKERVVAGVPAFLPALPPDAPGNRLGFARWLVAPANPLTARVTVNRQWQAFFGRGLVRTTEDFGYQGESPTHPELLDWLACEFMQPSAAGVAPWDMKALHRMIVLSSTYRQSARAAPGAQERDPSNVWLSRGPQFRLDAEIIRDSALKAAGLLSSKMGGPGVYPPQPVGVTEVAYGAKKWLESTGEDRYRRSLYTFMKRAAPFAMFSAFDGPTGYTCVARREISSSPQQALTLLNDTMLIEAAQAMGRGVIREAQQPEDRAQRLFRRCLTRLPEPGELALLTQFAREQQRRFAAGEIDPKAMAGPALGDPVECATWTAVARAILNFDETITKN